MSLKSATIREQPALVSISTADAIIGLLSFLTLVGLVAGAGRLFLGLSASTGLTDGYPWGIWIGFDFTLIAFAGTGFTMAAVVHVLHLKQYQPVLRPAILAGLMGYGAVLLLLVLDLGRPDRFYHFIIYGNLHSPLFEISWCVLLYTTVLVVETSPCLLRWLQRDWPLRLVYRLMTPVTIIGVTLSTLHQSTLGTLYLNMPHRLHPLWYTPLLPLLFLVSSVMAGLSLGMLIYKITSRVRGQAEQPGLVSGLGRGLLWVTLLYLLLKLGDMLLAGEAATLLVPGQISLVMGLELIAGALLPLALLLTPAWRERPLAQWAAPLLVLFGVLMNRFNATMFAQLLPSGTSYSPHILEWLSTLGILAGAALLWYLGTRFLLRVEDEVADRH